MARATLVGAAGSGRSVLLALLYASLVRYGGERGGRFSFHADPAAVDLLGGLYESLRAGELPTWPPGSSASEVALVLNWAAPSPSGAISHLFHPHATATSSTSSLALNRMPTEQLQTFLRSQGGLTAGAEQLLDGGALLATVDGSVLPIRRAPDPAGAHPWDADLARLLAALRSADRDHPAPHPRKLELLLCATKLDQVPDPIPPFLKVPGIGTLSQDRKTRMQAARSLLDAHFPATSAALASDRSDRGLLLPPVLFLSRITVEPSTGGPPKLKGHQTPGRGWEPEYPYQEFVDLVEELGALGGTPPGSG